MRHRYHISAKAALFSPDGRLVLLTRCYHHGAYGLPGGHLEGREDPEDAVRREIREELGIDVPGTLHKSDFFHGQGKFVITFTGVLDPETPLVIDTRELESVVWTEVEALHSGAADAGAYTSFILSVAPSLEK